MVPYNIQYKWGPHTNTLESPRSSDLDLRGFSNEGTQNHQHL